MQPISGDTYAVWIADDDGLDRAHDAELLLYEVPAAVAGDVSSVWISADGYQWSYDNRLEELTGGTTLQIPSLAVVTAHLRPMLISGALLDAPTLPLILDIHVPALSSDLILRAPGLPLVLEIPKSTVIAGASLEIPPVPLRLHPQGSALLIEVLLQPLPVFLRISVAPPEIKAGYADTPPLLPLVQPGFVTPITLLVIPSADIPGQTVYDLTLTGSADGEDDITLPLARFQGRLRSGTPSYLQAVVPNAPEYADAVTARPNGQLVIRKGKKFSDGSRQMEEIARVNLERIGDDRGGSNKTLTLSGHRTITVTANKGRTLEGVTFRHSGSGKKRYRARLDQFLRPGDTAWYSDTEYISVGLITYIVEPGRETMEITEA